MPPSTGRLGRTPLGPSLWPGLGLVETFGCNSPKPWVNNYLVQELDSMVSKNESQIRDLGNRFAVDPLGNLLRCRPSRQLLSVACQYCQRCHSNGGGISPFGGTKRHKWPTLANFGSMPLLKIKKLLHLHFMSVGRSLMPDIHDRLVLNFKACYPP